MNRFDKWSLRIVIPFVVSVLTTLWTIKHYEKISYGISEILRTILKIL